MSDHPVAAETHAIDRLERALDRIAALVGDIDADAPGLDAEDLRARIDQLVVKLRATLAVSGDADGG